METTRGYILGLYWDNGKENGNYYRVYIGVILGIMEKKMEATLGYILGLYCVNGKEMETALGYI